MWNQRMNPLGTQYRLRCDAVGLTIFGLLFIPNKPPLAWQAFSAVRCNCWEPRRFQLLTRQSMELCWHRYA